MKLKLVEKININEFLNEGLSRPILTPAQINQLADTDSYIKILQAIYYKDGQLRNKSDLKFSELSSNSTDDQKQNLLQYAVVLKDKKIIKDIELNNNDPILKGILKFNELPNDIKNKLINNDLRNPPTNNSNISTEVKLAEDNDQMLSTSNTYKQIENLKLTNPNLTKILQYILKENINNYKSLTYLTEAGKNINGGGTGQFNGAVRKTNDSTYTGFKGLQIALNKYAETQQDKINATAYIMYKVFKAEGHSQLTLDTFKNMNSLMLQIYKILTESTSRAFTQNKDFLLIYEFINYSLHTNEFNPSNFNNGLLEFLQDIVENKDDTVKQYILDIISNKGNKYTYAKEPVINQLDNIFKPSTSGSSDEKEQKARTLLNLCDQKPKGLDFKDKYSSWFNGNGKNSSKSSSNGKSNNKLTQLQQQINSATDGKTLQKIIIDAYTKETDATLKSTILGSIIKLLASDKTGKLDTNSLGNVLDPLIQNKITSNKANNNNNPQPTNTQGQPKTPTNNTTPTSKP